jgi:hypothetical protein
MRRNNKALYEQIMRNVSKEVKKVLNESTDLIQYDSRIRQMIYEYFEKDARDAWYQGCLESPREQDWYIEDYKRNFWSYHKEGLYNNIYSRLSKEDNSIIYEDVEKYIRKDIGTIDIDKIIEEAHYDVIDELTEENEYY